MNSSVNSSVQLRLVIQNLGLTIQGRKIFEEIEFQVSQGSFLAIMGPNGAGKTMLLKTLMGLYTPTAGRVRFEHIARSSISYVPQVKGMDPHFPLLGIELVVSGLRRSWPFRITQSEQSQALSTLAEIGADHLALESVSTLSGGERQRLYLARSFISKPQVLLLDEPVTGIDRSGEEDLYGILDRYRSRFGGTILMVTHDFNMALHHASDVLVIHQKQLAFGRPSEALTEEVIRRAFGHTAHTHPITPHSRSHV